MSVRHPIRRQVSVFGRSRHERHANATGEIATRLFISPHAVQEHLKSIFAKAGAHSRRELMGNLFLGHYQPLIQPIAAEAEHAS